MKNIREFFLWMVYLSAGVFQNYKSIIWIDDLYSYDTYIKNDNFGIKKWLV